ncbi:hypothetical protein BCR44DRAFT_38222 [Catenaria anguillulae PL171]|uniref:Uncharacterized protein n=1 Tax=Catenaria anguillulae PL171 TaxID=765915 RepID=A0A1Y2HE66_9FUNG|nr:hypothetical protein BCR44DRAFT_38222 [Catenaria anguillulae PL171]
MNPDTLDVTAASLPPAVGNEDDDEVENGDIPSPPQLARAPTSAYHHVHDSDVGSDSDLEPEAPRYGALPVARFPIGDPNLPPVSGEEFLRRVRAEARSLPSVVASSPSAQVINTRPDQGDLDLDTGSDDHADFNDPRPLKRRRTVTTSSPASAPPDSISFPFPTPTTPVVRSWAQAILYDFERLQSRLVARRQSLIPVGPAGVPMSINIQQAARNLLPEEVEQQVPTNLSEEAWRAFLYPSTIAADATVGSANDHASSSCDPTTSQGREAICRPIFLLSLTQRALLTLIQYHTTWIDDMVPRSLLIDMARVAYALLVGVDGDVLSMQGAGDVRELGKQCARVMLHVETAMDQSAQELDEDGEEGAVGDDEQQEREWNEGKKACLALRIVLVVVSQKFGQMDLCEFVD